MISLFFRLTFLAIAAWCAGLILYGVWINTLRPYDGKAEGAVVLTGGDGRVEAGLSLLEQGKVRRVLISGAHPDVKVTELLKLSHRSEALKDKVDLGFSAQDTLGNADEAAEWVHKNGFESLIVVTSHYHMPRAMIHLGEQLPNVALYSYPVVPALFRNKNWLFDPAARRLLLADYNKFLLTYPQILLLRYAN